MCSIALEIVKSFEGSMRTRARIFGQPHINLQLEIALGHIKEKLTQNEESEPNVIEEIVSRLVILGSDMSHEHYAKLMCLVVHETHVPWPQGMIDLSIFVKQLEIGTLFTLNEAIPGFHCLDFWTDGAVLNSEGLLARLKLLNSEFEMALAEAA